MANDYYDRAYAQQVYQYLLGYIGNDIGVSALMGNMYCESAICPFRIQNTSIEDSLALLPTVRSLTKEQFKTYAPNGGEGYSLAQWTWYPRKESYYDWCGQSLLGDRIKSMTFIMEELENDYSSVYVYLQQAGDIDDASDYICDNYEGPLYPNYEERRTASRNVYDDFSGLPPIPPPTPIDLMQLIIMKKIINRNYER